MKKNPPRKRVLAFERLESKAAPAALLIALAPLEDSTHEQIEAFVVQHADSAAEDVRAWKFTHSVSSLLAFVDENTVSGSQDLAVYSAPTLAQCQAADEMMQLQDAEMRHLVLEHSTTTLVEGFA